MSEFKTKVHRNDFLFDSAVDTSSPTHLHMIILNSTALSDTFLRHLWKQCDTVTCCDGGANRLYQQIAEVDRHRFVPQVIIGDLDSLLPSVEDYYKNLGTEVLRDHDQDSNDLEKALSYLQHHRLKDISTQSTLLIIGGFGGRFDHELANIHALYRWEAVFHRLVMLDAQGYTELLEANHTIHRIIPVRNTLWTEGYACGLLPMGHQVEEVTTTGLMWNLDKEPLAFGHRISSSNIIPDDTTEVTVQVSQSIIWTCSFRNTDITRA